MLGEEEELRRQVGHLIESEARHQKVALLMDEPERRRLMQLLLTIHKQAMASFDALEANAVSEHDVMVMAQLPLYVNQFTAGMKAHAQKRVRRAP